MSFNKLSEENKSLNISKMYQKGMQEFFKLLPKALYFGIIFFMPYLIFRYSVTPPVEYGFKDMPFIADILNIFQNVQNTGNLQNLDFVSFSPELQQVTEKLQSHFAVTNIEDISSKINWYIVGAEIFRLIMNSYFAFYIIYLCVGYAKNISLTLKGFLTGEFHRKFGRAVLAQLMVFLLVGLICMAVVFIVGGVVFFAASFIMQEPEGALRSLYIAVVVIAFIGVFFVLSVLQFIGSVFISGYTWFLAIGIMYHDISFSKIYSYVFNLFKGLYFKVFCVFLLNIIIVAVVGFIVKLLFWPLKIAFILENISLWIFNLMRDVPLISATNLMLGILTTAFFLRLENVKDGNAFKVDNVNKDDK